MQKLLDRLPMILTLGRVALIPVFIVLFLNEHIIAAATVFIVASLTDALDGHIARKRGVVSDWGKLLDPLADKILVVSALILFVSKGIVPDWSVVIILAREFAVTGLRTAVAAKGLVLAAGMTGKIKTVFQMGAIIVIFLVLIFPDVFAGEMYIAMVIYWIAVLMTVISGTEYFIRNRKLLKNENIDGTKK